MRKFSLYQPMPPSKPPRPPLIKDHIKIAYQGFHEVSPLITSSTLAPNVMSLPIPMKLENPKAIASPTSELLLPLFLMSSFFSNLNLPEESKEYPTLHISIEKSSKSGISTGQSINHSFILPHISHLLLAYLSDSRAFSAEFTPSTIRPNLSSLNLSTTPAPIPIESTNTRSGACLLIHSTT